MRFFNLKLLALCLTLLSGPIVSSTPSGESGNGTEAVPKTSDEKHAMLDNRVLSETADAKSDQRSTQPKTTFHVTTELVVLPITVTDKNGNFVSGLRSEDFRVYENGRRQKISFFEREDVPVTVGLIVDHSRSMEGKLPAVSSAISNFAQSSNPNDEMFVVDFSDRVWPELFAGRLFTNNTKELEGALLSVAAQGQTALYDGVCEGLARLQFANHQRKALIIVSDGGDNSSQHNYSDVVNWARQSQATIYSIGLVGGPGEEEDPRALAKLSQETGGLAFFPKTVSTVKQISEKIARDLRQQYTIGYGPQKKTGDDAYRKIKVKVSAQGRGKLHVRTRAGYSRSAGHSLDPAAKDDVR